MDTGTLIFLTLVGFVGLGLGYFRLRDAFSALFPSLHYVAQTPEAPQAQAPAIVPARRSDALERDSERDDGSALLWTQDEAIRILSSVKIIGADGRALPISKRKIALVAGLRADEVAGMVRSLRGEPDPAKRQIALRHNGNEQMVEVDW